MQRAWCSLAHLDETSTREIARVGRTSVYVRLNESSPSLQGRSLKKC
jgi:hypothetical protein